MATLMASSRLPLLETLARPSSTDGGEPACFFTKSDIAASLKAFSYAVIAKTSFGRPSYPEIKEHLRSRLLLTEDFTIAPLDKNHLLLRLKNQEDYLKMILRESVYVKGKLFRFFKWTMTFRPGEEPSILPVWVEFPGLPANFFHESMLTAIAGSLGNVLQVAFASKSVTDAAAARVCVELDVLKDRCGRIWIGTGDIGTSFWQPVTYPTLPNYCTSCKCIGHASDNCRRNKEKDIIQGMSSSAQVGVQHPITGKQEDMKTKQNKWIPKPGAKAKVSEDIPESSNRFQSLAVIGDDSVPQETLGDVVNSVPIQVDSDGLQDNIIRWHGMAEIVSHGNMEGQDVNALCNEFPIVEGRPAPIREDQALQRSVQDLQNLMCDSTTHTENSPMTPTEAMVSKEHDCVDEVQPDINAVTTSSDVVLHCSGKEMLICAPMEKIVLPGELPQDSITQDSAIQDTIVSGDKMKAILMEVCKNIDAEVRIKNEMNERLRLLGLSSDVPIHSRSLEDYGTIQEDDFEDLEEFQREVAFSDEDFIPVRHLKSRKASLNHGPRVTKSGRIIRKPHRY